MMELIDSNAMYDYWFINDEALELCCGVLFNKLSETEKVVLYVKDRFGDFIIPNTIDELEAKTFVVPVNQIMTFDCGLREDGMDKKDYIDFNRAWSSSLKIYLFFLKIGISVSMKYIYGCVKYFFVIHETIKKV